MFGEREFGERERREKEERMMKRREQQCSTQRFFFFFYVKEQHWMFNILSVFFVHGTITDNRVECKHANVNNPNFSRGTEIFFFFSKKLFHRQKILQQTQTMADLGLLEVVCIKQDQVCML